MQTEIIYRRLVMEQTGVTALISKWEFTMGKEGTLNRLRAMRDYAEKCLKEHPREKCADALDDNMCLIEAVVAEAELRLQ